ncbi:replication initiator [Jiangella rhizosphaerae]|uniref:Replication initiation protein n=1 Tax=Jiangella rhizosphaerae TaxID=2293569 RepID=A0A418KL68_9ACTN|nr:replication initiator [Jiangella rhizosphaerae]RIQ18264.1 replication initiation protein [Jiangella rhizosphaerae]
MTSTASLAALDVDQLAARLSQSEAERSTRGCSNPIRLQGSSVHVDAVTGEVVGTYSSDDEHDGYTYVRCGNRREAVCPSCSREYKGDAWHVLMAGLVGGHGVPETVRTHPSVFVTLTAPSFGPVHRATSTNGHGKKTPCRARRDRPVCPHGRPLSCTRRHTDDDRFVGQPLCRDCYDYTAHVVWQWHAPELWRRFTIALRRQLARSVGLPVSSKKGLGFVDFARVAYTKVTEFQARGVVHFHAVVRLDGPTGPDSPPLLDLSADDITTAVRAAAAHVYADADTPHGDTLRLRWGTQLDTRTITLGAGRDNSTGPAHPEMVGGYLSKYLTKGVEDFGLPTTGRIRSASDARHAGATDHACRIIAAAARLVTVNEDYQPIARRLATLGYRGHPITKSRAYGVTFGSRREARRTWRRRRAHLEPDAVVRDVLDLDPDQVDQVDAVITLGSWTYAGRGYLTDFDAANAVRTHTLTRIRRAQ